MFAATATGSTRSPFLPDIARDLGVSLPAVANLFGVTAASWGIAASVVGYVSDRIGRAPILIGAPVCIALAMLAVSRAASYESLFVIVALAGICCGSFTATILAEVSLRAHVSFHGRAFGYVMAGQSLTLLIGVPLAAWLGARVGWRGTHVALAILATCAVLGILIALRQQRPMSDPRHPQQSAKTRLRDVMSGPIVRLFLALITERLCFGLAAFYYASYLRKAYQLPVESVALPLAVFAVANIVGTVVGGQIADRFPFRRISFGVALIASGVVAIPWFLWQSGLMITVFLGALFAFFTALARPSLLASLAEVPAEVRGAVMGLNSGVASIGWLIAALVGGWFYAGIGFQGFGPLMAVMCLAGALLVAPDSRLRQRHSSDSVR